MIDLRQVIPLSAFAERDHDVRLVWSTPRDHKILSSDHAFGARDAVGRHRPRISFWQ
jgi:hypothetical protein